MLSQILNHIQKLHSGKEKNSEPFQQKAMWKIVLAMLYGAHLHKEDFYCT